MNFSFNGRNQLNKKGKDSKNVLPISEMNWLSVVLLTYSTTNQNFHRSILRDFQKIFFPLIRNWLRKASRKSSNIENNNCSLFCEKRIIGWSGEEWSIFFSRQSLMILIDHFNWSMLRNRIISISIESRWSHSSRECFYIWFNWDGLKKSLRLKNISIVWPFSDRWSKLQISFSLSIAHRFLWRKFIRKRNIWNRFGFVRL